MVRPEGRDRVWDPRAMERRRLGQLCSDLLWRGHCILEAKPGSHTTVTQCQAQGQNFLHFSAWAFPGGQPRSDLGGCPATENTSMRRLQFSLLGGFGPIDSWGDRAPGSGGDWPTSHSGADLRFAPGSPTLPATREQPRERSHVRGQTEHESLKGPRSGERLLSVGGMALSLSSRGLRLV